ncbi:hypothetical protein E4U21_003145 [Claviceps maximensis]|nr:hypothetical protein E4U21_003145 [Claviceps maximensis]
MHRLARRPARREHHVGAPSPPSSETDDTCDKQKQKQRQNHPQTRHEPNSRDARTRFFIDPQGSLTHDKTTVDVVAVPCPGAHPHRSWNRDGIMSRHLGAVSVCDADIRDDACAPRPSSAPAWIRQGIRREADFARVLLYEHPGLDKTTTLDRLADALLDDLQRLRDEEGHERPVLFIGHSLGGLVVKMALIKAGRHDRYENILRECYGVAFFGTPHQGSSYFAMPSLAGSIRTLLQLSSPLPSSITDDLRVGNGLLVQADEDFRAVSHDLQVWTFYETLDSRFSGGSGSGSGSDCSRDVYFTAPLTSTKSAILGMRQERIFPLQSDHANMASFGPNNVHTLGLFLKQLACEIGHAHSNAHQEGMGGGDGSGGSRSKLRLEQKVMVEVHGFFDNQPARGGLWQQHKEEGEAPSIVRAWSTRLPLQEFLHKGPEVCLRERLNEMERPPEHRRPCRRRGHERGRTALDNGREGLEENRPSTALPVPAVLHSPQPLTVKNALGIRDTLSFTGLVSLPPVDPAMVRPVHDDAAGIAPPLRTSSPLSLPPPLLQAGLEQDMAVDRLSPPLRGRMGRSVSRSFSLGSEPTSRFDYEDVPPLYLQRRRRSALTEGDVASDDDKEDLDDASPRLPLPELVVPIPIPKAARRHGETVIVDGVPLAFTTPDVTSRKFVWVHVPFNNPTWVKSILQTLEKSYKKDFSSLYGQDFWMTRHARGRHAQHYAYHAKAGCYFYAQPTLSPRQNLSLGSPSLSPPRRSSIEDSPPMSTCLFLPYLHFDSYKRLIRRRNLIIQRLSQGRTHPVPESVAKSDSLELQVMWEYLGHDPPVNCRRTLDQYEYPSLRDTRSRDDDQMLYKMTKERGVRARAQPEGDDKGSPSFLYSQDSSNVTAEDPGSSQPSWSGGSGGSGGSWKKRILGRNKNKDGAHGTEEEEKVLLNGNVLMVDQLWLWVIQSHTVLSFFPKRESDPIEGPLYQQADLRDSIFNEVNVDLTRQCENALDLAALAALHAVTVLLDRSSHPDLEIFRIFEEAISLLTERLTSSMKEFRAEGFRDKAFDYEPVDDGVRSIRRRHKEEGRRAERENRDNTSALLELRDIEDELQTLLHLFERQAKVIVAMHAVYHRPELRDQTTNGRSFLDEALKRLGEYAQHTNEMMQRVRATRDDYDKLLQMVQRQAQVDEVRLSRLHADLASAQSRSVMIFTTFTVIFLPLTFFTGLFGMNTREWGGGNNLSLRTIGTIALPASALLVMVSLLMAFSTNARRVLRWMGRGRRRWAHWMNCHVWGPVMVKWRDVHRGVRRSGAAEDETAGEDRKRSRRRRGLETELSDFWDRNRPERERGYRIPEVNVARVRGGVS